ncbi:SulA-like leucine-rich domain-containing protein [Endozoicomonas arenosclerae]|uniref:SulA-like leucine-rich domain-containing protein n=1 Tax=Endozoicomonas arenosclerae TaxID=1633495 RepID=UPI000782D9E7|nr:SulA-like leucine-rich domain-containing protein [Endozoicomonas arenosclerae]
MLYRTSTERHIFSSSCLQKNTVCINRTHLKKKITPVVKKEPERASINELILSGQPWQAEQLLTPMLNQLSNDSERWLTVILADKTDQRTLQWLKTCGLDNSKVQIFSSNDVNQTLELTQKALASGTSHTVISWLRDLDKRWLSKLENAARNGQCQGLAIRSRQAA